MIYKFEAETKGARLEIFGIIGEGGFTFNNFVKATEGLTDGVLTLVINSRGGDANEAFAIHDYIKDLKVRCEVEIYGEASSAATIIAAAADYRRIAPSAKYLVHFCSTIVAGTKKDTQMALENQIKIDNQMLAVYVKQTGKTEAELTALMERDIFLTAEEARDWGFVNEIINTKIETMSKIKIAAQAEDVPNVEELEKRIEELENELTATKAKLKAYEDKEEEKEKEEVDALVAEAEKVGLVTAENKERWFAMAKTDKTLAAETIAAVQSIKMPSVPKITRTVTTTAEASANLLTEFKAGKITAKIYAEKLNELKN